MVLLTLIRNTRRIGKQIINIEGGAGVIFLYFLEKQVFLFLSQDFPRGLNQIRGGTDSGQECPRGLKSMLRDGSDKVMVESRKNIERLRNQTNTGEIKRNTQRVGKICRNQMSSGDLLQKGGKEKGGC